LQFCFRIRAGIGFAFQGGALVRRNLCLGFFFGPGFHRHHSRFFCSLHRIARRGFHRLAVTALAVGVFRGLQLLLGLGQRSGRILVRRCIPRNTHGVPRFK